MSLLTHFLGDDEGQIEMYAATMSVDHDIPFDRAKQILSDKYKESLLKSFRGNYFDQEEFDRNMWGFINKYK